MDLEVLVVVRATRNILIDEKQQQEITFER
jgi:hypothetical protein